MGGPWQGGHWGRQLLQQVRVQPLWKLARGRMQTLQPRADGDPACSQSAPAVTSAAMTPCDPVNGGPQVYGSMPCPGCQQGLWPSSQMTKGVPAPDH